MICALILNGNLALAASLATLIGVGVAAAVAFRYRDTIKASQDAALAWKEERDAEKAQAERLIRDLATERERTTTLGVELAKLQERTDLRPLLDMQRELHEATLDAFHTLGDRAQDRHDNAIAEMHRLEASIAGQFASNALLLQNLTEQVKRSTKGDTP